MTVSRELLVSFLEKATEEINKRESSSRSIYKAFEICGLNPWASDQTAFTEHLDNLEQNKLYDAL